MTGLRSIAVKFAAFALASALLLVLLVNTMTNGVAGDTKEFTAEFSDVNGLRTGDDVKAAGVRVGRVTGIEASETGATVTIEVVEDQVVHDNTRLVMRYADLLGQRYIGLVQPAERGAELDAGTAIPESRTDPGFDLTELLNGFRPLFEVLQPADVNSLATSVIKVLQGEGGTVEGLLRQTADLTDFLADRDEVVGEVMANLTPVLENLAGQGTGIRRAVVELRDLMAGLARDRKSIGRSIDGIGRLVGTTSALLREVRAPMTRTSDRLATVAEMLSDSRGRLEAALPAFAEIFEALGRATSYENALDVYVCSFAVSIAGGPPLNLAGDDGPWSEVCRG